MKKVNYKTVVVLSYKLDNPSLRFQESFFLNIPSEPFKKIVRQVYENFLNKLNQSTAERLEITDTHFEKLREDKSKRYILAAIVSLQHLLDRKEINTTYNSIDYISIN